MINVLGNRIVKNNRVFYTTLSNDLILCLELDETSGITAFDSYTSDNSYINSNATINQTGIIDKSYSFNGVDSQLSNSATLGSDIAAAATNALTISIWFKTTTTGAEVISEHSDVWVSYDDSYVIYIDSGLIYAGQKGAGVLSKVHSSSTFNDGNWHNAIVVLDRNEVDTNQIKLYIDNVDVTIIDSSNTLSADFVNYPNYIGARSTAISVPYSGNLDQYAIWTRALISAERSLIYNSGVGLAYASW